jgi:hypothetical protein
MHRINLISTNKFWFSIIIFLIIALVIGVIAIYTFSVYLFSESAIGKYILEYIHYIFILVSSIIIYFSITGIYYYRLAINSYVIQHSSSDVLFSLIKSHDFLDISHDMLQDYSFFNRPFSFNKTLVLRIKKSNRKLITKRFNLTLISNKEIEKISNILNKIIAQNNCTK